MTDKKSGSVLPDNSSPFERGLERGFNTLLYDLNNPFPGLLNPQDSPIHMLSYLAQDRGVMEWDATAPESEHRQTVTNALRTHQLAGTKRGIELALDSLEYDAEIKPWYQMTPRGDPYTFNVIAWKRDNAPVNQDVVSRMLDNINAAKAERDVFELSLALGLETSFSICAAHDRGITIFDESYSGQVKASPTVSASVGVAGISHQTLIKEDTEPSVLPNKTACEGAVFVGGAHRMIMITNFSPEAKI